MPKWLRINIGPTIPAASKLPGFPILQGASAGTAPKYRLVLFRVPGTCCHWPIVQVRLNFTTKKCKATVRPSVESPTPLPSCPIPVSPYSYFDLQSTVDVIRLSAIHLAGRHNRCGPANRRTYASWAIWLPLALRPMLPTSGNPRDRHTSLGDGLGPARSALIAPTTTLNQQTAASRPTGKSSSRTGALQVESATAPRATTRLPTTQEERTMAVRTVTANLRGAADHLPSPCVTIPPATTPPLGVLLHTRPRGNGRENTRLRLIG